jgi:ribosomal protein L11 methyltransferase
MWRSVSLLADALHADQLSDLLLEHGAVSVSIEDADAGTPREQPQFGESEAPSAPLWSNARLIALFDAQAQIENLIEESARRCGMDTVPMYDVEEVAERNWVALTQSQFQPLRISGRLWIVPSWHVPPDPEALSIVLDPGMAFGTGTHPTTQLCLEWLSTNLVAGESMLDYGCGSGILAIAAAKLGASPVFGVDIDEQALSAAAENARRNCVEVALIHASQPLRIQFDRVIANILANPLVMLAPLLASLTKPGGRLVLSGVLSSQVERLEQAYRPFMNLGPAGEREGWVVLEGRA